MSIIDKIGVLGDSILRGVVLDEKTSKYKFTDHSAVNLFTTNNKVETFNYSKFGCTSDKALKILPRILKDNFSKTILIELGGNDCDFNWDEICNNYNDDHEPNVTIEQFKQNIRNIIEQILAAGKNPCVMTLPPIDGDKYFKWICKNSDERSEKIKRFIKDVSYIYRHQELYSHLLESVAREYKTFVINVRDTFLNIKNYSDYLCLDGIHLNENGQKIMQGIFGDVYKMCSKRELELSI